MGLNLYVWHEDQPTSSDDAQAKIDRWNAGDEDVFVHSPAVASMHSALVQRFPGGKGGVWTTRPKPSDQVIAASCGWMRAGEVSEVVIAMAAEHGLVCYEPASRILNPNVPGYVPDFVLTAMGVPTVPDPDAKRVDWVVRRLNDDHFFALLDRADGQFAQVGYGRRAGLPAGTYALEYHDGSGLFQTETGEVDAAVRFLQGYLAAETWRHKWRRLDLV